MQRKPRVLVIGAGIGGIAAAAGLSAGTIVSRVGLWGYDLCAHVKQLPRLRHIPVVLTTSSAYPSDYSSAHSLGAVVCMAKPYKMERIANIARVLAPPPALKADALTARPADPTRLPGRDMVTSRTAAANAYEFTS